MRLFQLVSLYATLSRGLLFENDKKKSNKIYKTMRHVLLHITNRYEFKITL